MHRSLLTLKLLAVEKIGHPTVQPQKAGGGARRTAEGGAGGTPARRLAHLEWS